MLEARTARVPSTMSQVQAAKVVSEMQGALHVFEKNAHDFFHEAAGNAGRLPYCATPPDIALLVNLIADFVSTFMPECECVMLPGTLCRAQPGATLAHS